jgi:hypothetical protein
MDELQLNKPKLKPKTFSFDQDCCPGEKSPEGCASPLQPLSIPIAAAADDDAPCCGPKPGPPSSPYERPGYRLMYFVEDFMGTDAGPIPRIKTTLGVRDFRGTLRARTGISRDRYRVAPGLYCVGKPDPDSPVLVTANYKLSFDSLRRELDNTDAWILVLDTRGVNVWCAAGKRTFSTDEVIRQVQRVGLEKIVNHRELILPQLGAPGISSHEVKKGCGFNVIWGPIRASDIKGFLNNGKKAEPVMRQLTFTIGERLVLIPVELSLIVKPTLYILLAVFVLSGINPQIFTFSAAWSRGVHVSVAYLLGVLAGAVAAPALLPWLPTRQFYVKGIITGLVSGILTIFLFADSISNLEALTLLLLSMSVSSYAAMNFTGATPFTSPSGVEKEMRQGIPIQAVAVIIGVIAWISSPFVA